MKVSCTELPPRQVSLAIEVEQERLDRASNEAYQRLAVRVDVPGFRRGKAPRSMVERLIGRDRIVEEALEHLIPEVVNEAIEQEKLEPYTRPRVESIEFEPLRIKAVVGLAPKVELGDYKDELRVPTEEPKFGDAEVEAVIERLRTTNAQWIPVERAVQLGDQIGIDLKATVEGRETPLVDSKDATFNVDADGVQPAPGFVDQIVGLEPEKTKTFELTMAEDYRDPEVAGKKAEFTVILHWVKERELPAVDDEFAQQMGEYSDVASLRSAIETQIRQREEERVREQLEEAAMSKLVEISSIEFPPQLVEHQAEHMLETFTRNVEQQGLQLSQYLRLVGKDEEDFKSELRTEAESRVRRSLALDAFADAEKIDVERHEVEEEVHRAAEGTDDAEAVERLALSNPNTMSRVEGVTRERKAMARLLEVATGNGHDSGTENPTEATQTSDTQRQSRKAAKAAEAEEDRETA